MLDNTKPVDMREMDATLTRLIKSAPNFNAKDLQYVDDNTINGEYGFDFYSWTYWGMQSNHYCSICAMVTDTYTKYQRLRQLQKEINLVGSN
jgi:hypothetical protein